MSLQFYLYRAPEGTGPITSWQKMEAERLGNVAEVKNQLSQLFPQIQWQPYNKGVTGLGSQTTPYLDVMITEYEVGSVFFVVFNKPPPSVMRVVMEQMNLNHACVPEADTLIDPYGYDDEARYYKKKE